MAVLSPNARQQFFTSSGEPAANYRLFTYASGSTTAATTYKNRAGTSANTNPIILDEAGRCVIYLDPNTVYDYWLKTPEGATEWMQPGVAAEAGGGGGGGASIADAVTVADEAGLFTAGTVETVLKEIGERLDAIAEGGGATTAGAVSLADADGFYTGATLEAALAELGPTKVLRAELADGATAGKGAALVKFRQAGSSTDRDATARFKDTVHIGDFGPAVGDNSTNNSAIFTAAEDSPHHRIYLPAGTYYTGKAPNTITKQYVGPGILRHLDGTYTRGWGYIAARPDRGVGVGTNKFFSASPRYCEARELHNFAPRIGQTEAYYAPECGMRLDFYNNQSGYSGTSARLTLQLNAGATSATVTSTDHLNVGDVVIFTNIATGTVSEQKTITAKTPTTFSWSGGIAAAYPAKSTVSRGSRTMHAAHHYEIAHGGGGDCYANLFRIYVGGTTYSGQTHFFDTKTGGIDGGDVSFSADGTYATGREVLFAGGNYDVACIGNVMSYSRNNGTGAREAVWIHDLAKSEGSAPGDAVYAVAGRWKCALDTTRGYFGDTGKFCAINMGADTYQYWDSSPSTTKMYPHWGENIGDSKTGYNTTAQSLDTWVDGHLALRLNQFGAQIKGRLISESTGPTSGFHNHASGLAGTSYDFIGSGTYTPTIIAGNNCSVASSAGTGAWFYTRVGRMVTVRGTLSATLQAANAASTVGISLPISADLTQAYDVTGTGASDTAANMPGRVYADAAVDRAVLSFTVAPTGATTWSVEFSYLVK